MQTPGPYSTPHESQINLFLSRTVSFQPLFDSNDDSTFSLESRRLKKMVSFKGKLSYEVFLLIVSWIMGLAVGVSCLKLIETFGK